MAYQKKRIFRLLFGVELMIFTIHYLFGAQGISLLHGLKKDLVQIDQELVVLQDEITRLEKQLVSINNDPFYKEKIAREQLQMARKDELIYMIEDNHAV